MSQAALLVDAERARRFDRKPPDASPFKTQLLKWVGNKQRFAHEIVGFFPDRFGTYHEPFLGSGAVLATLAPLRAKASDSFGPLIGIFQALKSRPDELTAWYAERWHEAAGHGKAEGYERIKARYNERPNAPDFLYLTRACYGGVIRFRRDGYMSTPVGIHTPISPDSFSQRVQEWHKRVKHTDFQHLPFESAMLEAGPGDLIYCDPPYSHTQAILYGAQDFSLERLFDAIADCKRRGARVALSIDGSKKTGEFICDIPIPKGLFEREVAVNVGRSMLRRFQMEGRTLEREIVTDRLLLTY
ncbi:DNA adenine methylase [Azospirillum sp. sgz302134]